MKTKFIMLFALVLCMSAFLLPMTAYAAASEDTAPPTVSAWITGEVLHIEAADTGTGVEAVYINDERFNYRVDGALEVSAEDYAGDDEQISVYAVDFSGNKSDTVEISNPYYVAPTATTESAIPTDGQAFTPDGTGTVVDDIIEQNGKEFFSITTAEGNIFYLIIDRYGDGENVYLLNAVTEDDLMALAEKSEGTNESAIPSTSQAVTSTPDPSETETTAETEEPSGGGNTGMMIFLVIAVLAVGGAGYYIKIVKPKQQAVDDDDEEEFEDDEEMEFEDEPDDGEESDTGGDYDDYGGEPERSGE